MKDIIKTFRTTPHMVEQGGVRCAEYEIGYEQLTIGDGSTTGETVILLNGSLFNLRQWDTILKYGFLPALPKGIQIIRYDYGGTGRSPRAQVQWDLYSVARELETLRAALGFERVHLYGISKGTIVGQLYAALYPERVRSLAGYGWFHYGYTKMPELVNFFSKRLAEFKHLGEGTAVPLGWVEFSNLWQQVYEIVLSQSRAAAAQSSFARWFAHVTQQLMKKRAFSLLTPTPAKVMYDWFDYAVRMLPEAETIFATHYPTLAELPILIQHARKDGTLPFTMAEQLSKKLPAAKLVEYGTGYNHVSVMINPLQAAQIARDYAAFLKKL